MANLIQQPIIIRAAGHTHKEIAEYVGRLVWKHARKLLT